MSKTISQQSLKTEDRYFSRVDSEPAIVPRADPVVYGEVASGPLDSKQLKEYECDGFLHFESLLSLEDLEACAQELYRLRTDKAIKTMPQAVIEPDSQELRSVFAVHEVSDVIRQLCGHPELVSIAEQLLAGPVYVHQARANYKSGFRGEEFYWHSDFETWHVEDGLPAMRTVSCSISLTENTAHNGPLMLIPGSHHHYVRCVGETPQNHYKSSLRRQRLGVPDDGSLTRLVQEFGIVSPIGPVGSVTFFDCNVMHGSNSNITPLPRSNLFIVYNSLENKPVEPFCGLAPRPNHIGERKRFINARELGR